METSGPIAMIALIAIPMLGAYFFLPRNRRPPVPLHDDKLRQSKLGDIEADRDPTRGFRDPLR